MPSWERPAGLHLDQRVDFVPAKRLAVEQRAGNSLNAAPVTPDEHARHGAHSRFSARPLLCIENAMIVGGHQIYLLPVGIVATIAPAEDHVLRFGAGHHHQNSAAENQTDLAVSLPVLPMPRNQQGVSASCI